MSNLKIYGGGQSNELRNNFNQIKPVHRTKPTNSKSRTIKLTTGLVKSKARYSLVLTDRNV